MPFNASRASLLLWCILVLLLAFIHPEKCCARNPHNPLTYVVKKGDTLSETALRYQVSVSRLRQWNLIRNDEIIEGQELQLWPSSAPKWYVVRSGDTLSEIAFHFGVSISALRRLNHISQDRIYPGQRIMLNDLLRPFDIKPFSLFSVTPVGVAILLSGIVYFIVLGRFVLPREVKTTDQRQPDEVDPLIYYPELVSLFELENLSEMEADPKVLDLCDAYNIHTVALSLDGGFHKILPPDRDLRITPGSVFAVYGTKSHVEEAAAKFGFKVKPGLDVFTKDLSRDQF